jgi:hypothetical protein
MNGRFLEYATMKKVAAPKDINASAIVGSRVSLKDNERVAIAFSMDNGAGTTNAISFEQHDAAAAGNSKAVTVKSYFHKIGAATVFTKVELETAVSTVDLSAVLGGAFAEVVFEIEAQDLDVNAGYAYVSVNVAASAAAKVVSGLYILPEPKNKPSYNVAV